MNESINDEAVYRTAPATPGLLIRLNSRKLVQNNPSSLNRNKGISVILNKFKVVAATAFLNNVNTT